MKKIFLMVVVLLFSACSTKYILMDENGNPVKEGYYSSEEEARSEMRVISEAMPVIILTAAVKSLQMMFLLWARGLIM